MGVWAGERLREDSEWGEGEVEVSGTGGMGAGHTSLVLCVHADRQTVSFATKDDSKQTSAA